MRSRWTIAAVFILFVTCISDVQAKEDVKLGAEVEELYKKADEALEAKDLKGFMSLLTDDYQSIFSGSDRDGIRSALNVRFMGFSELRAEHTIFDITRSGDLITVINEQKLEGKYPDRSWRVIAQSTVVDLLVQQSNSLKFARSAQIDKDRLKCVNGQTYRNEQTGFSFTVPENWRLFPVVFTPHVSENVFVLAHNQRGGIGIFKNIECYRKTGSGKR